MILKVVKTTEPDLVKAFGITLERAKELSETIGKILLLCNEEELDLPETMTRVAEVCQTNEELTLVMFTMGDELAEHRIMHSAIPVTPGVLGDILTSIKEEVDKGPKKFDSNVN